MIVDGRMGAFPLRNIASRRRSTRRWGMSEQKIKDALDVIQLYGGIDGGHHKQWVIDQVARRLLGDAYSQWVVSMKDGEDGPNTYEWDEGIAP
jgi:hypothetical protein